MNKRVKKRIAMHIITGSIVVIISLVLHINNIIGRGVFTAFFSLGIGFFILGCKSIYKFKNDPSSFQEDEIKRRDERNIQLWNKASNISFAFTLFALLFLTVLLDDLGYDLPSKLLFGLTVLSFGFYLASYWYLNKKF